MDKVIVGLVIGIVFAGLQRESISHVNIEHIMSVIKKCPNNEYIEIKIKTGSGAYTHKLTKVYCADGSTIEQLSK